MGAPGASAVRARTSQSPAEVPASAIAPMVPTGAVQENIAGPTGTEEPGTGTSATSGRILQVPPVRHPRHGHVDPQVDPPIGGLLGPDGAAILVDRATLLDDVGVGRRPPFP